MAANDKTQLIGWSRRVPELKPGKYGDGLPLDEVKYLECKIILKPNHFTSRESLFDFGKVLRRPAKENGVGFDTKAFGEEPLQIREVLFLDTADFRLYNNAFILRRRIPYKDGSALPGGAHCAAGRPRSFTTPPEHLSGGAWVSVFSILEHTRAVHCSMARA